MLMIFFSFIGLVFFLEGEEKSLCYIHVLVHRGIAKNKILK